MPCRSFGHAYAVSSPGDVVELAGGSYGPQWVPEVAGRVGPVVEFRPAAGAVVSLDSLSIAGDWVRVRDLGVSGRLSVAAVGDGVWDVRVASVRARTLWLQNAHRVAFVGGGFGGNVDGPTVQIAGEPASTDLSFDGVDFHDAVATNSTVHMECIWAGGVQGFTVRNSVFRNCAYFNIFFTRLNGPDPKDVLLENNVFEVTKQWNGQNAPYAINVANWLSRAENFVFRNNVFGGDVAIQPATIVNMRLVGNVGRIASCKSGVSYSHNVFTSASCSASDQRISDAMSQFVDPAAHDWRLRAGAAAIDAGDPADHPATDRDGLARVGTPDAGAHEYGGSSSGDAQAPSAPAGLSASGGVERASLSWQAATDDVGVVRYDVHRSTQTGFSPSSSNRVAQVSATSYEDAGLAPGTYFYRVTAADLAGNVGPASEQTSAAASAQQTSPTVALTAPASGQAVSGTVSVQAAATDDAEVAGVQFKLDGADLGAEDTSAPYAASWDTTSVGDGSHALTAVARDASGDQATSEAVTVGVVNLVGPLPGRSGSPKGKPPEQPKNPKKRSLSVLGVAVQDAGGPTLRLIALKGKRVCERPRPRCRRVARLRLRVSERALLRVTVKRRLGKRRARRVSSTGRRVRKGLNVLNLSARGWRQGRYRLTVRAVDAAGEPSRPAHLRFTTHGRRGASTLRVRR